MKPIKLHLKRKFFTIIALSLFFVFISIKVYREVTYRHMKRWYQSMLDDQFSEDQNVPEYFQFLFMDRQVISRLIKEDEIRNIVVTHLLFSSRDISPLRSTFRKCFSDHLDLSTYWALVEALSTGSKESVEFFTEQFLKMDVKSNDDYFKAQALLVPMIIDSRYFEPQLIDRFSENPKKKMLVDTVRYQIFAEAETLKRLEEKFLNLSEREQMVYSTAFIRFPVYPRVGLISMIKKSPYSSVRKSTFIFEKENLFKGNYHNLVVKGKERKKGASRQ